MQVERRRIAELKPHPKNPRVHPKSAIDKLTKSIQEFGWTNPVLVSKDGFVLAGHARLKAAEKAGFEEVPVIVLPLEGEKADAYLIADNRLQEETDWDMPLLKEVVQDLFDQDYDLTLTGLDAEEIDKLLRPPEELVEDDFDPEEEAEKIEEPITKPGDVWQLGEHRLICGDATVLDDIQKLMDGAEADMVFTDPPYNVDYTGKTKDKLKIQNDRMEDEKFRAFLYDAFTNMFAVSKPGAAIYVCHADSEGLNFRAAMKESGWLLKQCLIWVKNSLVMGRQDYHWRHEPILYGWKPGASHKWFGGRKQDTVIEDDQIVTIVPGKNGATIHIKTGIQALVLKVSDYKVEYAGDDSETTIWRIDRPTRNSEHPTMKPIALVARALQNSSEPGAVVLDPFGGSGSTLIAAEQTGRKAYLVEFDPKYCDVIVKRWETFTGKKAQRR